MGRAGPVGNVVPAGSKVHAKVFSTPDVRVFYEFTIGLGATPGDARPWGATGEGERRREGGWLGDHSAPGAAAAVGESVWLGATLAEAGDNLIRVDLQGEKLWGGKLSGWSGTEQLVGDGDRLFALLRRGGSIVEVDTDTYKNKAVFDAGGNRIRHFAAHDGSLLVLSESGRRAASPFRYAIGNGGIDFVRSRPQVLDASAPTEFTISPQAGLGNIFTSPGNPQTGARFVVQNNAGYLLVVFKEPTTLGTLMMERMSVEKMQLFALRQGIEYVDDKHSPLREAGGAGGDEALELFSLTDLDENWVEVASDTLDRRLNIIPLGDQPVTTRAIYIKVTAPEDVKRDWRPGTAMARLLRERVERVDAEATLHTPVTGIATNLADTGGSGTLGWHYQTRVPVSDVYPSRVVMTLDRSSDVDGLALLNPASPSIWVDAYVGPPDGDPAAAVEDDAAWKNVGRFKGGFDKKLRALTASTKANEQFITFDKRIATDAFRFRIDRGYRGGKWGESGDDPFLTRVEAVTLLKTGADRERITPDVLTLAKAHGGNNAASNILWQIEGDYGVTAFAYAPDGQLYTIAGGKLNRSTVSEGGFEHTPLTESMFSDARNMDVSNDRIAVGDAERDAVYVFNHGGELLMTLGGRGPRVPGPWDPNVVDKPSGVAIASDGSIWVAEEKFAPKRVARFASDGHHLRDFFGPPMYGGGGHLDPDLGSFYYRSMQFSLDWDAGTSRLAALNDTVYSPTSPAQETSSFSFTSIGKPMYVEGRRYIVGGDQVSLLPDGASVWQPAAVWGPAHGNAFLMGKAAWREHFARIDLTGKNFLWNDTDGEGDYDIEEVTLFEPSDIKGADDIDAGRLFSGVVMGPDLTLWGHHIRWRPHAFSYGGVPLYRVADIQTWGYGQLAPHYPKNYTLGGPKSAKPGYKGFRAILPDGSAIHEAQPYIIAPDLTVRGGAVDTKPSDYLPDIDGTVLNQPWSFTGVAQTDSPVGAVALVNSNNGYWYVWAAEHGVVLATLFDGSEGGWGWDLATDRGTEVTHRKHAWEAWGGDFIKARNGNYYTVAGKGFHAISRIEGLDDFDVQRVDIQLSSPAVALNTELRPILKARDEAVAAARSRSGSKLLEMLPKKTRLANFRLDGDLEDWGAMTKMQSIGPERERQFFDATWDDAGLTLAFAGEGVPGGSVDDWRRMFRSGYAFEVLVRPGKGGPRDAAAGDVRIVVGKVKGEWTAVMYDYVDHDAQDDEELTLRSDVATTHIDRVAKLGPGDVKLAVREGVLGIDLNTLSELDEDFGEVPTLPGDGGGAGLPDLNLEARPIESGNESDGNDAAVGDGKSKWTAELFLPWKTLGMAGPGEMRADFGIRDATGGGLGRRRFWSDRMGRAIDDEALDAAILPGAWGTLRPAK